MITLIKEPSTLTTEAKIEPSTPAHFDKAVKDRSVDVRRAYCTCKGKSALRPVRVKFR